MTLNNVRAEWRDGWWDLVITLDDGEVLHGSVSSLDELPRGVALLLDAYGIDTTNI